MIATLFPRGGGIPPPTKPGRFVSAGFCWVFLSRLPIRCRLRVKALGATQGGLFSHLRVLHLLSAQTGWGAVLGSGFLSVFLCRNNTECCSFFFLVFGGGMVFLSFGVVPSSGFLIAYFFGELVPSLTPTMDGYIFLARNNGTVYAFCTLFSLFQQSLSEITIGSFPDVLALRFLS